jgi:hypothetical protein
MRKRCRVEQNRRSRNEDHESQLHRVVSNLGAAYHVIHNRVKISRRARPHIVQKFVRRQPERSFPEDCSPIAPCASGRIIRRWL